MRIDKTLNAALFPYDNEMYPYLQNRSMIERINIVFLLSPVGWALTREKVFDFEVQTALSEADYERIDAIWITDSVNSLQEELLYQLAEDAFKHKKQVIVTRKAPANGYAKLMKLAEKYAGILRDMSRREDAPETEGILLQLDNIYTPVISVAGIGERTDKFILQLALKEYLESQGYKTAVVSSRSNSFFLHNVYPFPQFMEAAIPNEYKIVLYNHFIKRIELEDKPEVIITGIPGGIMPISKLQAGTFGIRAFEVFNAVTPDFLVMCLYGNDITDKYINELKNIMRYKFAADIDGIYLSNTTQDVFTVNRNMPVEYLVRGQERIEKLKADLESCADNKYKIFTAMNPEALGRYAIECLNENAQSEVL